MKKTLDIKKLILLNMPYILLGLFATNFGEAWRMAQGTDASEKFLSLVAVLPGALQSFWPSLHPLDLLVGLCCGVGLRLAVYLKSKNAKKYRHGLEYGSARWGTREDIASYVDRAFFQAIPPGTEHTGVIDCVLIGHELSGIGQKSIFISQTKGNIIGWLKAETGPFQIGCFQKCKAVILFYRVCC